jgi:hypothetical protein
MINITLIVCAIYLFIIAFAMKTKNFISSLLFKFIPFFIGLACTLTFLGRLNIINLSSVL